MTRGGRETKSLIKLTVHVQDCLSNIRKGLRYLLGAHPQQTSGTIKSGGVSKALWKKRVPMIELRHNLGTVISALIFSEL